MLRKKRKEPNEMTLLPNYNASITLLKSIPFFANISIPMLDILFITVFILTVMVLVLLEWISRKHKKRKTLLALILHGIVYALLLTAAIFQLSAISVRQEANQHGCEDLKMYTLQELTDAINTSPKEDTLPENLSGSIILFYRFDCADCEAVYHQLSDLIKDHSRAYWVSTRSKQGKKLRETYPIKEVPSGLFIMDNGHYKLSDLITAQHLYTDALDELLFLQRNYEKDS